MAPSEKRYTLSQLRGAYAAGAKGQEPKPHPARTDRLKRAMEFAEQELWEQAQRLGARIAFGQAGGKREWANILLINLFNEGGSEVEADEVRERIIGRLAESGVDRFDVELAEHCLECRLEEVQCRMEAMARAGYR